MSEEAWWWHWLAMRVRVDAFHRAFNLLDYSLVKYSHKERSAVDETLWWANMRAFQVLGAALDDDPWMYAPPNKWELDAVGAPEFAQWERPENEKSPTD